METLHPLQEHRMERRECEWRTMAKRSIQELESDRGSEYSSRIQNKPTSWSQERVSPRKKHGTHIQEYRKRKQARGRRGGKKKKKASKLLGQGIFNLSNVQFTQDELGVLELGLKYAPDKPLDKFEAYIDLQKFLRKLYIKKTFCHESGRSKKRRLRVCAYQS